MNSTMQDSHALTVQTLFNHGAQLFACSKVVTFSGTETRHLSFAQVAERIRRLAVALQRLGVQPGDRVGTFCWNQQEHLEAYFAVPCMGAVLHTVNIRLFAEQLAYTINHAGDRILIVDATLLSLLAPIVPQLQTVEHFIVVGNCSTPWARPLLDYEQLLAAEEAECNWPSLDERSAAAMCYTSGTTGNPKGVVYSHRSIYLHAAAIVSASGFALNQNDRALVVPPMFHANSWGIPHAGWWVGADLILPGKYVQAEPLSRLIAAERPTFAAGVPTIWNDLIRYAEDNPVDLSSFRLIISGGSAVPRSLIQRMQERHGVRLVQIWGMTETGPIATIADPPKSASAEEEIDWRAKTGRVLPGLELRIVVGEEVLPWDGESVGEIEVRGPWVAASYYRDPAPEKFHDGWLCTGDVGTIDAQGFVQITDRAKDVIKSGGEWISSVELENQLMAHPDVIEAAVVAVPDERWDERPLACVVVKPGSTATVELLRQFLMGRVARWWLPERWAVLDEVPKTSVGKFDKKLLRSRLAQGEFRIVQLEK
jgi:fatty-acyl-CoA synthase